MKIEDKIESVAGRLESAGVAFGQGLETARDEAAWVTLRVAGYDLAGDLEREVDPGRVLDADELGRIDELVTTRIRERRPFAYLFNEAWFAGHRFYVDERVIIPRSYLGEWVAEGFAPWIDPGGVRSVLDLCTGCGCIAISCALAFPGARVVAGDVSADALEVAKINVADYKLEDRVSLHRGDGFEGLDGPFDLIVCNPPYVSDERMARLPPEYLGEPVVAFQGGGDGLDFIVPLLRRAADYLDADGALLVEAGSASHALERRFDRVPFTWMSTEYDEMVVFCMHARELRRYADWFNDG